MIGPGYLRALGARLRRGREFGAADDASHAAVAIVNETLARRFFPEGEAVGGVLEIRDDGGRARKVQIVGVLGDVKHYALDDPAGHDVYVPIPQIPKGVAVWLANNMFWVLRTSGDPLALAGAVRGELRGADPEVAAGALRSMEQALGSTLAARRFNLWLLQLFGLAALALAACGTFAVTAQSVSRRTRELGVRIALGAGRRQILGLVYREAGVPVAIGLALGVAAAPATLGWASGLLFGVSARDPLALLAAVLLLGSVALLAIDAPARRATRVDPVQALRE
jgi:hypothetical protein